MQSVLATNSSVTSTLPASRYPRLQPTQGSLWTPNSALSHPKSALAAASFSPSIPTAATISSTSASVAATPDTVTAHSSSPSPDLGDFPTLFSFFTQELSRFESVPELVSLPSKPPNPRAPRERALTEYQRSVLEESGLTASSSARRRGTARSSSSSSTVNTENKNNNNADSSVVIVPSTSQSTIEGRMSASVVRSGTDKKDKRSRRTDRPSRANRSLQTSEDAVLARIDWNVLATDDEEVRALASAASADFAEDLVLSDTPTLVASPAAEETWVTNLSVKSTMISTPTSATLSTTTLTTQLAKSSRPLPIRRPVPSSPTLPPSPIHIDSPIYIPSPRVHTPPPPPPDRPSSLRRLATKLIHSFPHNEFSITSQVLAEETLAIMADYEHPATAMLTPLNELSRQNHPNADNGVHVFIDHSNILVGLLSVLSTSFPSADSSRRTLSMTPNLSLLLQRGRPLLAPPALVASSPLWQNLNEEKERGWDVCVLKRVRVDWDGDALVGSSGEDLAASTSGASGSSEESDEGGFGGASTLFAADRFKGRVRNHAGAMRSVKKTKASARGKPAFVKRSTMKEQGVDELLQLKILQTLLSCPPATLVLATGDAAGSSLNASGFLGCVQHALSLGWDVEVWGWRTGLSGGWRTLERKFGGERSEGEGRFWVAELDAFAEELEG